MRKNLEDSESRKCRQSNGNMSILKEVLGSSQEDKPAAKKRDSQKAEKPLIEKTCKNCKKSFLTTNPKKEACSQKCRSAFNRRK